MVANSSSGAVPRMTLTRSRFSVDNRPLVASRSTASATSRLNSCVVSVAPSWLGGIPYASGSNSTGSRKAPRLPYVLSGVLGSGS